MAIFTRISLALAFCVLLSGGAVAFELVGNGKPADASCYPILNDPEMPDDLRKEIEALPCIPMYKPPTDPETLAQLEAGQAAYDAEDWEKAYDLLKPLADGGEARAMFLVARLYDEELGVKKDHTIAKELYFDAGKKGEPEALNTIGYAYKYKNFNIQNNTTKAEKFYLAGAAKGLEKSARNYAKANKNSNTDTYLYLLENNTFDISDKGLWVVAGSHYYNDRQAKYLDTLRKLAYRGDHKAWWILHLNDDPEAQNSMTFVDVACAFWAFLIIDTSDNYYCKCKNCPVHE